MPFSIGTALTLAKAGFGALGAIGQGRSAKRRRDFEARLLEQRATQDREISRMEESDFRRRQSRALASRRAAAGASGVDISTGSPLIGIGDFAREVELQAQRIRFGGEVRASRLEQQASLARISGRNLRRRGLFRAGSSLLSGFAEAFG